MFEFPISYTAVFGQVAIEWGVHETVAGKCKAAGIKKALITTTALKGTGIVDEINQILTANGVPTEIFDKVTSNPKNYEVMEAYNVFKNAECDGVVSVGGGSSHDCGKGDRAVAANDGKYVYDMAVFVDPPYLEQIKKSKLVIISQISVNTTADTGAESTNVGMGIVHGLGHGLSVLCGCHHGRANAVMALPLERYNEPSGPDKFTELAGAMGVDMRGMTKMQAADKWFDEIERLLADLNIKTGHLNEQFGLQHEDLEHIVRRQYENDFAMERNRIDFVFEDCIKLLEDLL